MKHSKPSDGAASSSFDDAAQSLGLVFSMVQTSQSSSNYKQGVKQRILGLRQTIVIIHTQAKYKAVLLSLVNKGSMQD